MVKGPAGFMTRGPTILPVTIGGPGHSTTLHTVAALTAYLPTRGAPGALRAGERDLYTADDLVHDGGGKLSGETAALTLALYLSDSDAAFDGLGTMVLSTRPFCTQGLAPGDDGLVGTADDCIDPTSPVTGPWVLSRRVIGSGTTVRDLLASANQYLQGTTGAASAVEVYGALARINRAFYRCRRIVECK